MADTTYEAARDEERALIAALTPSFARDVPFRRHVDQVPLRAWAEENAQACFRVFEVRDRFDYALQGSINGRMSIQGAREVVVAYPIDFRYGNSNARDLGYVMWTDARDIETAIGERGHANLTNHVNVTNSNWSAEPGDAVQILTIVHSFDFWRTEPT